LSSISDGTLPYKKSENINKSDSLANQSQEDEEMASSNDDESMESRSFENQEDAEEELEEEQES
jgi:hypothetical protein